MNAGQETQVRVSWARRSAAGKEATHVMRAEDILTQHQSQDGRPLGPYETAYDLASGYQLDREIITP